METNPIRNLCERHRVECKECRQRESRIHRAAEEIERAVKGMRQVLDDLEGALDFDPTQACLGRIEALRMIIFAVQDIAETRIAGETCDRPEKAAPILRPVPPVA